MKLSELTKPVCIALVTVGWLLSTSASAKDKERASPDGSEDGSPVESKVVIKVGPEHSIPGEMRYPARTRVGQQGLMVEFNRTPLPTVRVTSSIAPPSLEELIANPDLQAALDRSAKPGDFVTPPAAMR